MKKLCFAILIAAFTVTSVNAQGIDAADGHPGNPVQISASGGTITGGGTIWDNGPPDGVNGYSNATVDVFGARRALLDDFTLDQGYLLQDFHWQHVWGPSGGPLGSSMELSFREDAGGTPGNVIATANITSYMEQATGDIYFSRDGMESWVEFDDIKLDAGTYWWEATIVGPENNFWLTSGGGNLNKNECWTNYDDFGGLQPGSAIFGVQSDLNFRITGVKQIPEPASLGVLALGTLVMLRRRRS